MSQQPSYALVGNKRLHYVADVGFLPRLAFPNSAALLIKLGQKYYGKFFGVLIW